MSEAEREREDVAAVVARARLEPAVLGLTPFQQTVMRLQRTAGNGAVGALLRRRRLLRAPRLPGFTQDGDSCGAASMVTALFLWDLERGSPNNAAVVHACDLILAAKAGTTSSRKADVEAVRKLAMTPGYTLGLAEYQKLSTALAFLYNGGAGMSSGDIFALAGALGLSPGATGGGATLREILNSDAVRNLKPGEVGQLNWVLKTGGGHAMLLGRHEDGTWFFSDQGLSPPTGIQVRTHPDLVSAISSTVTFGNWLFDGSKLDLSSIPPVTGFRVLGHIQSFLNRGPTSLIAPGEKLAEIDAGWRNLSPGEVISAWDYHSRHETLADAKDAIGKDPGPHGGVIIECPPGMFHVWKTNPIKDKDNLKETKIDASDSTDMVLVKRLAKFTSAWVVLSDPSGKKSAPFAVKS